MYDIETKRGSWTRLDMIGVYDGRSYQYFKTIPDFLNHVLVDRYNGWRFFAHFGGRFDVHFIFDYIIKHWYGERWNMEIICAGSCVIAFVLAFGRRTKHKETGELVFRAEKTWRFVDSYRLMPKSLKALTYDFNVEHKKLDLETAYQSRAQMLEYNENDCLGLYEVLSVFFDLFDTTSETLASHAMRVFRKHFLHTEVWQAPRYIEEYCRLSYTGGRCELFRYNPRKVNAYDVNSLYPKAMLDAVPVEYKCASRRLPDNDGSEIGFYDATISYPDTYLPILPIKVDKLYFATGSFRGYFTSCEIRQAIEQHNVGIKIHSGYLFRAERVLADYAEKLYSLKVEAERKGQEAIRYIAKIMLNALYGKFGQRREQRLFCMDDGSTNIFPLENDSNLAYRMENSYAVHIMPQIASVITSRARLINWSYLNACSTIWYTDTDSIYTPDSLQCSDGIGNLKHEGFGTFTGYRSKEYEFNGHIKLKGVPQRTEDKLHPGRYIEDDTLARQYLEGQQITFERKAGLLESIRDDKPSVRVLNVTRQRRETRDKRKRIGNDTRPWSMSELTI